MAHEWIEAELTTIGLRRTGSIEQPHVYPWSTVLRIPTDVGNVWFKANEESMRHEAALVTVLANRRSDCVPPLLSADPDSGWMLMTDAGTQLRAVVASERSLDRWFEVLPLYADLQLDFADSVDEILELGVPDRRLPTLQESYQRLLDEIGAEQRFHAASQLVDDLCDSLASYEIPETIQHDDLHDGQIFVRDARHLLLDWGDACVSHPFFTLSVTLEGGIAWGLEDVQGSVDTAPFRDAYLAPFAERHRGDLAAACDTAARLGWVCRAINGHVAGDDEPTQVRLRMFLDGHP